MTHILTAMKCAALLALVAALAWLAILFRTLSYTVPQAVADLSAEVDATRAELDAQLTEIRTETLSEVNRGVEKADSRLASIQSDLNIRTRQALRIADSRAQEATGAIAGLRGDLAPTLRNTAALTGHADALAVDAKDSWDDMYWDLKASVESGTAAMTSAAQASEAVRDAAPKVAASVVGIGQSSDGIAADVKREVDEATRPKKWWQKALGPVYTVGRLVAVFL